MKVGIVFIAIITALCFSGGIAEAILPGWSEPVQITTHWLGDSSPTLIQDKNGTFWVAWRSARELPSDIWISNSTDGIFWSAPVMITENSSSDNHPTVIQDSNGTYWLAFYNGSLNADISIQNSSDGINWNTSVPVVSDGYDDIYPKLMQDSNGTFWIVWESQDRGANNDIYYATSDDGVSWSAPVNIPTNVTYFDYEPYIIEDSNGTYWVAWVCGYGSVDNICIANSTDGSSWSSPQEIITGSNSRPTLTQSATGLYWLVWAKSVGGNRDIYFSTSANGSNWSTQRRITINISDERNPSVIMDSNGTIWVAYESDRSGRDIYLVHSTVTLTSPLGGETWNGTQNITWVSVSGDYQNDTFSLYYSTDGASWTLINSSIPADGVYTNKSYEWNTSDVSDGGNYTIKIVRVHPLHNESNISGVFTIDNALPGITIASPANTTYSTSSVPLNYSVSEPTFWEAYSLDGKTNKTGGNRTLYGLSHGSHYVTVWANDTAGNMNSSTVYFQVDINGTNISVGENYTEGVNITYGENVNITAGDNVTVGSNITYTNDSDVTFSDNVTVGDGTIIEGTVSVPPGTIISSFAKLTDGNKAQAQAGKKVNITYTEGVTVKFVEIPEVAHTIVDLIRDFNVSTVSTTVPGLIEVADNDTTPDFSITIAANGSVSATVEVAECEINPENGSGALANLRGNYLYVDASEIANKTNITIKMKYPSGLLESSVKIYRFNASSNVWTEQSSWIDGSYVYTNVSGFSVYGVAGEVYTAPSDGGGGSSTKIFMLANSIDYNLSANFTAYMTSKGVKVEYLNASNFTKYRKMRNIVILGGPDAPEGVGEIVQDILNETERAEVRAKGSERFYMKEDVWTGYQRVFILAGSDRLRTQEASIDNKETVKSKLR